MPTLTEYVNTLNSKIKQGFLNLLPDEEQWRELTTSRLPNEEAEVTRLCKLLTAQRVIDEATLDANLRNGKAKTKYDFQIPIGQAMKAFSDVTKDLGNEDSIDESMQESMPGLCSSYFKNLAKLKEAAEEAAHREVVEESAQAEIQNLFELVKNLKPGDDIKAVIQRISAVTDEDERNTIYKNLVIKTNIIQIVFKIAVDVNNVELLDQILELDADLLLKEGVSLSPGDSVSDEVLSFIEDTNLLTALSVFGNNPRAYKKCLDEIRKEDIDKVVSNIKPDGKGLSPEIACEVFSDNRKVVLAAYAIEPLSIAKADIKLVKTLVQEGKVSLEHARGAFKVDEDFDKAQKATEEAALRKAEEEAARRKAEEEAERRKAEEAALKTRLKDHQKGEQSQTATPKVHNQHQSQVVQAPQVTQKPQVPLVPKEPNDSKVIKEKIVDVLIKNIRDKKEPRASWFDKNSKSKIEKLQAISSWLSVPDRTLDDKSEKVILALIRDVCAIKRNTFGLFQPHSVTEFGELLSKQNKNTPDDLHLNADLSKLEKGDTAKFIDDLISQTPSSNLNPPG